MKTAETAQDFLAIAKDFQLGSLETEQPHPLTVALSSECRKDLCKALDSLKAVDLGALCKMEEKLIPAMDLIEAIEATWNSGGRVYLAGCGATGRLSLSLEVFCREGLIPASLCEQVVSFMAGGDAALIRSIEGFEDFPDYGARQLRELGFGANDLLIASTEGGETPWVIGATEEAARISRRKPWFVYCNPEPLLCQLVERSRKVIGNAAIRKWNLAVGPMAIAGSTRMQATTVLEYGIGLALELAGRGGASPETIKSRVRDFRTQVGEMSWNCVAAFTKAESSLYRDGKRLLYATEDFGVSVLTDTTERAPTFSLSVFETYRKGQTQDPLSLCYLALPQTSNVESAWQHLLRRAPRCLLWPEGLSATRHENLMAYDISGRAAGNRQRAFGAGASCRFIIERKSGGILWKLNSHEAEVIPAGLSFLEEQIMLKMLLNAHSTLVMGRLGRYEGNLMTFVKPSNNKLIDRGIRYVQTLYRRETGAEVSYEEVCLELFRQRGMLGPDDPIVLKTLDALEKP